MTFDHIKRKLSDRKNRRDPDILLYSSNAKRACNYAYCKGFILNQMTKNNRNKFYTSKIYWNINENSMTRFAMKQICMYWYFIIWPDSCENGSLNNMKSSHRRPTKQKAQDGPYSLTWFIICLTYFSQKKHSKQLWAWFG